MKNRLSTAALALGFVSGGAVAGPLADLINTIGGPLGADSGLTAGAGSAINTLTGGFNDSPLSALTTLPTVDPAGDSLVGIGAFESAATGNGQLIGVGAGNDNQNATSGSGALVGLGALQSGTSGNSELIGVGALTGDNSGNGGLVGLSALSDGGGASGQGGLIGAEVLNGDTLLGLNSGIADQSQDILPNPTGASGTQITGLVGEPVRDGLQGALQRSGDISGPLEGLVTTLDGALVEPLGDGLAPVTDQLAALAGVGIDGDGTSNGGAGSLANAIVTGDSSGGNGSDINAGVISNDSGQGDGDVVGAGAFSGDDAGGNGILSLSAISGGNSGNGGDANVGVANSGDGAASNGGGLLGVGVANNNGGNTGCTGPGCGVPPKPPVDNPNPVGNNSQAEETCDAGDDHNETGLQGAGQLTQFSSRRADQDGCKDVRLQQLSSNK
jgi:hypothetical protein